MLTLLSSLCWRLFFLRQVDSVGMATIVSGSVNTNFQFSVQHFISSLSQSHFISALTVVFVNSKSLSSLKIDDTPVDDPSLKVLVANNSDTLKLLKMSSCPHVSPAGIVTVKASST